MNKNLVSKYLIENNMDVIDQSDSDGLTIRYENSELCISGSKTDLLNIPNVGKRTKESLMNIGITCIEDLIGKDPQDLYTRDCLKKGFQVDRCQLYLFRMAVYYAEHTVWEDEKLKWWYWKDKEYPETIEGNRYDI